MTGTLKLEMLLLERIGKGKSGAVALCDTDIKTWEEVR